MKASVSVKIPAGWRWVKSGTTKEGDRYLSRRAGPGPNSWCWEKHYVSPAHGMAIHACDYTIRRVSRRRG